MSNARPTCTAAGHCHGWATTWCHGCGSVSPCASVDCPFCGECDATMHEAQQRRARALVWLEDGGNVLITDGPPSHTWAIDDRHGNLVGVADGSTVDGAFLAWCELAGYVPDEWRGAVHVVSDRHWKRYRWRGGAWRGAVLLRL